MRANPGSDSDWWCRVIGVFEVRGSVLQSSQCSLIPFRPQLPCMPPLIARIIEQHTGVTEAGGPGSRRRRYTARIPKQEEGWQR